jgi:hypothetical protein
VNEGNLKGGDRGQRRKNTQQHCSREERERERERER